MKDSTFVRHTPMAVLLIAPLVCVAAAANPQAANTTPTTTVSNMDTQAVGASSSRHYIVMNGDSMSGSWSREDEVNDLKSRYGDHFAWFQQNGHDYVVTDPAVLAELDKAMEPQRNVNHMQGGVNEQQAHVNAMQKKVNEHQNEVNALQHEVNHRQDVVNQLQQVVNRGDSGSQVEKLESELREMRAEKPDANQASVNRRQAQVNEEQSAVNAEQSKVNAQQHDVNAEQHRVSAEFNRRAGEIFDSAVKSGAAKQLR